MTSPKSETTIPGNFSCCKEKIHCVICIVVHSLHLQAEKIKYHMALSFRNLAKNPDHNVHQTISFPHAMAFPLFSGRSRLVTNGLAY